MLTISTKFMCRKGGAVRLEQNRIHLDKEYRSTTINHNHNQSQSAIQIQKNFKKIWWKRKNILPLHRISEKSLKNAMTP